MFKPNGIYKKKMFNGDLFRTFSNVDSYLDFMNFVLDDGRYNYGLSNGEQVNNDHLVSASSNNNSSKKMKLLWLRKYNLQY